MVDIPPPLAYNPLIVTTIPCGLLVRLVELGENSVRVVLPTFLAASAASGGTARTTILMETKVVNLKKEPYDVYIGRGSIWGNPYKIGVHGTREEVIEMYRRHISGNGELLSKLHELHGKVLGCYCKPKACHGDVLVELVNAPK